MPTFVGRAPEESELPPENPPGPSGGDIVSIGPEDSAGDMETLMADLDYNVIELEDGLYDWKLMNVPDRTDRPLTIRPATGATVTFTPDPDPEIDGVWGIWQFAVSGGGSKGYVTIDGLAYDRMVYDGFEVGKAGIFMAWGSNHVTIRNQTFRNLTHSPDYEFPEGVPNSVQPYHSWLIYAKNTNSDLTLEDWWCEATDPANSMSAFQFETGTYFDVIVRRMELDSYYYAAFVNGDADGLTFDDWAMTDCGSGARSIWLAGSNTVTGSYANIVATGSDPLDDEHSGGGTFADGGGNSGI
jgi:hypothetical protein